jgi:DNA excision repair protein ERCC-2
VFCEFRRTDGCSKINVDSQRFAFFIFIFHSFLFIFIQKITVNCFTSESPAAFLGALIRDTRLTDAAAVLRFCSTRLQSLIRTLRLTDIDTFTPLVMITDFVTLAATHARGLVILMVG